MKQLIFIFLLVFFCSAIHAQQGDAVAVRINGKSIMKSEIEKAYEEKVHEDETFDEFLDSYIDFKLNIEEAKAQKLDTTSNYKRSYSSFRIQLSEEYNRDTIGVNEVVNIFHNRMKEDIEVNQIFLPFDTQLLFASDTIAYYKMALEKREEIKIKGFKSNTKLNLGEIASDHSIATTSGYIGWITPFMMPLEVEDMLYSMPIEKISIPVRSNLGYHIVQVINKRPAIGQIELEQVTFNFSSHPARKTQIDSLRAVVNSVDKAIKANRNEFDELCKSYNKANDEQSTDCNFGIFGLDAQLPASFLSAAFALKNVGDITAPILSDYGYHFIRLKKKISLPPIEEVRNSLLTKILRGDRSTAYTKIWQKNEFEKFNLSVNQEVYSEIEDMAHNMSPLDSTFIEKLIHNKNELFSINNDVIYLVEDFASHLHSKRMSEDKAQNEMNAGFVSVIDYSISSEKLKNLFNIYASRAISAYADSTLEMREPRLRELLDIYANGILLYEVKRQNIWDKAKTDIVGLNNYFEKNKSKYQWNTPRYKGAIIHCSDENTANKIKKEIDKKKITDQVLKKLEKTYNATAKTIMIQQGVWSEGENLYVHNYLKNTESNTKLKGYPHVVVMVKELKKPESYTDVRAEVEVDYQVVLEKEWSKYLRERHKIDVDNTVLKTIK